MTIQERVVGTVTVLDVGGRISASSPERFLAVTVRRLLQGDQKRILVNEKTAAYIKSLGVASSWDSTTFMPDTVDGGTLHDVHDDVAFASSIVGWNTKKVDGTGQVGVAGCPVRVLATKVKDVLLGSSNALPAKEIRGALGPVRTMSSARPPPMAV